MFARATLLLLLVACGGGPAAPTTPTPTGVCASYAYKQLREAPPEPAQAAAAVEFDRATTLADAGDHATAALRFLACARELRAAPADATLAAGNAEACYYNAAHAFANAGRFEAEGRAALDAAAAEDAPRAGYLRDVLLAAPPADCAAAAPPAP